ncbi:MAG TPA: DUF4190 domain-containing protein [Armatimonadota bacterium]|jgi:prepilin-type processing-associated H-X9-DG protein
MKCPLCGFENVDGKATCSLCGEPLAVPLFPPALRMRTSRLAVASLVLGMLVVFLPCALTIVVMYYCLYFSLTLLGLVLGMIALLQMKRSGGQLTGSGMAVGGVATSAFVVVMLSGMVALGETRARDRQKTCLNNQRQIAAAIQMWVQDHDGKLPDAKNWSTELAATYGINGKTWDCPTSSYRGSVAVPDYGYNAALSRRLFGDIRDPAGLLLTGDVKDSAARLQTGDSASVVLTSKGDLGARHSEGFFVRHSGYIVSYVDGHVSWLGVDQPAKLKP